MSLFDADEYLACPDCGESITADNEAVEVDYCQSCYVNEDCPSQCDEPHAAPPNGPFSGVGTWTCPTSRDEWYWLGDGGYTMRRSYGRGEWVEDETVCLASGDYISADDAFCCERCEGFYHTDYYCRDNTCDSCVERDYYDDGCHRSPVGRSTVATCMSCHRNASHWNPISENIYCSDHAGSNPLIPVLPERVRVAA